MCLLAVNEGETIEEEHILRAADRLPDTAPIIIMVHGFRYSPRTENCPHQLILAERSSDTNWKALSWPEQLGLPQGSGLGVGFGWDASGSIWQAYARVPAAGEALAEAVQRLSTTFPTRPIHIVTHSLGARVALHAGARLPAGMLDRILLISPAMFRAEAEKLAATEGLRQTEVISVTSPENTAYDLLFRAAFPTGGVTLGRGGPGLSTWLDVRLGDVATDAALAQLGYAIAPPRARICHWSGYLRGGIWQLYTDLLYRPEATPLAHLRHRFALTPARAAHAPLLPFGRISPS